MDQDPETKFRKLLENATSWSERWLAPKNVDAVKEICAAVEKLPTFPLLSEWARKSDSSFPELTSEQTERGIIKEVELIASQTAAVRSDILVDICTSSVTAEYISKTILTMVKKYRYNRESIYKSDIDNVIKICDKLAESRRISKRNVSESITRNIETIPLEALIALVDAELLSLGQYISTSLEITRFQRSHDDPFANLRQDLIAIFHQIKVDGHCELSVEQILTFILSLHSLQNSTTSLTKGMQKVVNEMIFYVFEEQEFKHMFVNVGRNSIISKLDCLDTHCSHVKTSFTTQLLDSFLNLQSKQTISDAYRKHSEWTFDKIDPNSVDALQSIFVCLDDKMVISIFSSTMRGVDCDFQRLLSLISIWLVCSEEAATVLKEALDKLFVDSIEVHDKELLKVTLLVARHCSLQNCTGFPSYSNWLQNIVSNVSFLSDRNILTTYVNCLTELLPVETREFLKVHLSLSVQVPASAKHLLSDYNRMGRTRLDDFKEDLKQQSLEQRLYGDKIDEGAAKEVEALITQYEVYGKIPKTVFEMSVFRKSYFLGSFLPALLNPIAVKRDESREKFVEELKKVGKIPSRVYQAFERACGDVEMGKIFSDSSRDFTEHVGLVVKKIAEMPTIIQSSAQIEVQKRRRLAIQSYLSSLSSHLTRFKEAANKRNDSTTLASYSTELADALLDSICHAYALRSEDKISECRLSEGQSSEDKLSEGRLSKDTLLNFRWVRSTVQMLANHRYLLKRLKARVLELLVSDMDSLEDYHLQALSCLVSTIEASKATDENISFLNQAAISSFGLAGDGRSLRRVQNSFAFISFTLFFCSEICSDIVIVKDDMITDVSVINEAVLVSTTTFNLWMIMYLRLKEATKIIEDVVDWPLKVIIPEVNKIISFAESVQQLNSYRAVVEKHELDLNQWLCFELEIDDSQDYLPMFLKDSYFYTVIDNNQNSNVSNNNWSYKKVATELVWSLLSVDENDRCPLAALCREVRHGDTSPLEELGNASTANANGNNIAYLQGSKKPLNSRQYLSCGVSNSILCLFRSLAEQVELESSEEDTLSGGKSWLFQGLESWLIGIRKLNDDETTPGCPSRISARQMHTLNMILDTVPSVLLFTHTLLSKSLFPNMNGSISMINDIASYSFEEAFYLPCSFTVRILNALTSYCNKLLTFSHDFSADDIRSSIYHFMMLCPVFSMSLVQHFSCKAVSRPIVMHSALYGLCAEEISKMHQSLQILDFKRLSMMSPFQVQVRALCIYNKWHSLTQGYKEAKKSELLSLDPDVLQAILECMFIKFTSWSIKGENELAGSAKDVSTAIRIIKKIPMDSIALITDMVHDERAMGLKDLRMIFYDKPTRSLFPLAVIKLLAKMDPLHLRHFAAMEGCRDIVLQCVDICEKMVKKYDAETLSNVQLSPFDLPFVKELGMVERFAQIGR